MNINQFLGFVSINCDCYNLPQLKGNPSGIKAKVLDCGLKVNECKLQLYYYIHFWTNSLGKSMNPLSPQLWKSCLHFGEMTFSEFQASLEMRYHLQTSSWCSRYRRRNWTRRHEFKFWTRLIAFHIALIPLGKVWIQLFSLQLWVNSRTD